MSTITTYDKTEVYEQIRPLLEEIKKICVKNNVPMAASFALKNDEDGTTYKNEAFMPISAGIHLKDDYLSQILIALNGGHFVPTAAYKDIEKAYEVEADPDDDKAFDIGEMEDLSEALLNYVVDDEIPVQKESSAVVKEKESSASKEEGQKSSAKVVLRAPLLKLDKKKSADKPALSTKASAKVTKKPAEKKPADKKSPAKSKKK